MDNKSCYVSVTGLDGCGKTTLVKHIISHLRDSGRHVVHVREPGGNNNAEKIRKTMFNNDFEGETDALMMAAARSELIAKTVIPALEKGCIVISDRSVACSCAYQGHVAGLGIERIWKLNEDLALHNCLPQLELFLDADTQVIKERLDARAKLNRFDTINQDSVREGYLGFYGLGHYRWEHIITHGTRNNTFREAMSYITPLL